MAGPSEPQKKEGLRCKCGKLLLEKDQEMGLGVRCDRDDCRKFHPLEEINQMAAEFEKKEEKKTVKVLGLTSGFYNPNYFSDWLQTTLRRLFPELETEKNFNKGRITLIDKKRLSSFPVIVIKTEDASPFGVNGLPRPIVIQLGSTYYLERAQQFAEEYEKGTGREVIIYFHEIVGVK